MRLFDTARGEVVAFEPGPLVTMYSCGITPYDAAHLGHAAVYLYFDMLQRRLQDAGHETKLVRNVTDVDDDILRKARELGVHYLDLAAEEMARFDAEMGLLNLLPVYSEPRATSAISEILSLIGAALESGHAYESGGSVYFSVATFPAFGCISGFGRDHMLALAAEQGGRPDDPNKRDPLDFVLWQPSLPDEPAWESRWGPGRPGWHIECSALALRGTRRDDRHPRGRARSRVPPPRVRDGPVRVGDPQALRAAVVPRGPGGLRGDEDVQVAGQPRLRGGPVQGVGPGRGPVGPARPSLPGGLGVVAPPRTCRPPRFGWRCGPVRQRGTARRDWRPFVPRSTTTSTRPAPCGPSTRRRRRAGRWPTGRGCWVSTCSGPPLVVLRGRQT